MTNLKYIMVDVSEYNKLAADYADLKEAYRHIKHSLDMVLEFYNQQAITIQEIRRIVATLSQIFENYVRKDEP